MLIVRFTLSLVVKAALELEPIMKTQPEQNCFQNINFQYWFHERDQNINSCSYTSFA